MYLGTWKHLAAACCCLCKVWWSAWSCCAAHTAMITVYILHAWNPAPAAGIEPRIELAADQRWA